MPCTPIKFGDSTAIVCSRGSRGKAWRCFCGLAGGFQCDWKVGGGKTCDAHLCPEHAKEVAPEKHLCPTHQEAYAKWKSERGTVAA